MDDYNKSGSQHSRLSFGSVLSALITVLRTEVLPYSTYSTYFRVCHSHSVVKITRLQLGYSRLMGSASASASNKAESAHVPQQSQATSGNRVIY